MSQRRRMSVAMGESPSAIRGNFSPGLSPMGEMGAAAAAAEVSLFPIHLAGVVSCTPRFASAASVTRASVGDPLVGGL